MTFGSTRKLHLLVWGVYSHPPPSILGTALACQGATPPPARRVQTEEGRLLQGLRLARDVTLIKLRARWLQ